MKVIARCGRVRLYGVAGQGKTVALQYALSQLPHPAVEAVMAAIPSSTASRPASPPTAADRPES
ncbi:hypothetical protein [Streptomyces sp. NPDC054834]